MKTKSIPNMLFSILFFMLPFMVYSGTESLEEKDLSDYGEGVRGSRTYQLLADSLIYEEYEGSFAGTMTPVFLFTDTNIFDSGNSLEFLFAGVYASLDFTIIRKPGFPFNITLHGDGSVEWGSEMTFYDKGQEMDWTIRGPSSSLGLVLSRSTESGFAILTDHYITFRDYESDSSSFTAPANGTTYSGSLDLSFSNQSAGSSMTFSLPLGFRIAAVPELIYQFDVEEWGPEGDLYSHDSRPAYKGNYQVSFYRTLLDRLNVGGKISYLHGENLYPLEKWAVGTVSVLNRGPRLDGYYSGEFMTSNSPLLNLDLQFIVVPDSFSAFVSHDVFYLSEEDHLYQGSALSIAVEFANSMDIVVRNGYGWNAERDESTLGLIQELFFKYSF